MTFKPAEDGITHINVYSKGRTLLGRFLSNFAATRIRTEDDGWFESVEGYWYWLGCKDDRLRETSGWESKRLGRELRAPDWQDSEEFKRKIKAAISIKIETFTDMKQQFVESTLPFAHYYTYRDKIVVPDQGGWILEHLEWMRRNYHGL